MWSQTTRDTLYGAQCHWSGQPGWDSFCGGQLFLFLPIARRGQTSSGRGVLRNVARKNDSLSRWKAGWRWCATLTDQSSSLCLTMVPKVLLLHRDHSLTGKTVVSFYSCCITSWPWIHFSYLVVPLPDTPFPLFPPLPFIGRRRRIISRKLAPFLPLPISHFSPYFHFQRRAAAAGGAAARGGRGRRGREAKVVCEGKHV